MLSCLDLYIALLSDLQCIFKGLWFVVESLGHFSRRGKVEILCGKAHPVLVINGLIRLDAEQHIVGLGICLRKVVTVVGGNERDPLPFAQFNQSLVH